MSLDEKQMLDVMAYADGELEVSSCSAVEKLIASSAEAKELLASVCALGDGVRGAFDVPDIDVRDVVMSQIKPNDLDKARIKRTARTRMAVVGASLVALAAAVLFYVHEQGVEPTTGQNTSPPPSGQTVLASASVTGVEVDFVDTPTPVSLFYVPAENSITTGAEGKTTETPASVVVWVDDNGVNANVNAEPTP